MYHLEDKKLFLLDMDGTLYLGDRLFDCTLPFLREINRRGGRYLYLTNNSSKSTDAYVQKLNRLGITAQRDEFLTSVDALIHYMKGRYDDALIYAAGTGVFCRQLSEAGFRLTDSPTEDVGCFVQGFDTELTFKKLSDASELLTRGVDFIATNPDWVCPTEFGYVPDCGSVCEMLFRATGKRPYIVGKPRPDMVSLALEKIGCAPEEAVIIGDRLYTDVACGVNAGIDSVLVLSGETAMDDVEKSDIKPAFILKDIGVVFNETE